MADPYQTLGVARTAAAADIKKAYRKLAKELHPDRNAGNAAAAERFAAVTAAYDLLSDDDKRARFDRGEIDDQGNPRAPFGFGGGQGSARGFEFGTGNADFGDIFDGLFGGRRGGGGAGFGGSFGARAAARGGNLAYRLKVDFVDAAIGAPQRITLGDGKTIDLKLPPGVEDGTQMRLAGKGEPGPGGAGDAVVTIELAPHPVFRRDGDDIRLELPVTLAEAVLGATVRVPTVEGPVNLRVPAGSSSGAVLRLRGRGWTRAGGGRGDQLATLSVQVPPDDEALRRWAEDARDRLPDPRARLGV